jgi:hypothetical protein
MAETLSYSDTLFWDGDWNMYPEGSGSVSSARYDSNGNPAPSRWVSNTVNADSTVYGFHMRRGATWYPAASGGITSLAFSIDGMPFADAPGDGMGFTFALRQGDRNFEVVTSDGVGSTAGVWKTLTYTGLTASNFRTVTGALANPDFTEAGAAIQFGFRTGNSSIGPGYTRVALFDNWSVTVTPVVPPALVAPAGPADRYRLSMSADSRSLLASARAVPFDASASVNLPAAVGLLQQQTLFSVREVTRAVGSATADAAFYPRATQNQQGERQYDGVTLLSRMRTSFPAPLADTIANLGIANNRASTIITFILDRWATEFAWFDFETVPDLRTLEAGASGLMTPSEYDTGGVDYVPRLGVVRSDAVIFPQRNGERLSMYDMLEALLSPFPSTVFFANSAGKLVIVPAYGPDADETPYRTLGNDDIASVSLGEANVADIINKATVTSRGAQVTDDVPLMQPAWFQLGPTVQYGGDYWYAVPGDRLNLQATGTDGEVLQETLTPADPFNRQAYMAWPISSTAIAAGSTIGLVDSLAAATVTVAWTLVRTSGVVTTTTGTTGLTVLNAIPLNGETVDAFELSLLVTDGAFSSTLRTILSARWDAASGSVAIGPRVSAMTVTSQVLGARYDLIAEFTLNDASRGVVEVPGPTVTYDASTEDVLGVDGVHPVQASQDAYGVLEERVDVRGYVLDSVSALNMARGLVLANLSPRAIRDVELTWRGSTAAVFDDRGRLFGLPDGAEGLLVGVQYQDDFTAVTASKRLRTEETVPYLPGFIPVASLLLNDDASLWQNDDETLSNTA